MYRVLILVGNNESVTTQVLEFGAQSYADQAIVNIKQANSNNFYIEAIPLYKREG